MWLAISKTDPKDTIEMPTEREAYDFCKESGYRYYYEFINIRDYMKRKTNQWKKQKKLNDTL